MANEEQNPDMDHILASIRRVIADDGRLPDGEDGDIPTGVKRAPTPQVSPSPERGPRMPSISPPASTPPPAPPASTPPPAPPASTPPPAPSPAPPSWTLTKMSPADRPPAGEEGDNLLTPESEKAATASFGGLMEGVTSTAATDEAFNVFIKSLLKPLLREWLNRHMPPLVERLVREEIDRITKPFP